MRAPTASSLWTRRKKLPLPAGAVMVDFLALIAATAADLRGAGAGLPPIGDRLAEATRRWLRPPTGFWPMLHPIHTPPLRAPRRTSGRAGSSAAYHPGERRRHRAMVEPRPAATRRLTRCASVGADRHRHRYRTTARAYAVRARSGLAWSAGLCRSTASVAAPRLVSVAAQPPRSRHGGVRCRGRRSPRRGTDRRSARRSGRRGRRFKSGPPDQRLRRSEPDQC
jgi:hypothetical protein